MIILISHIIELYNEAIDEVKGARDYIEDALELKDTDRESSKKYYEMTLDEIRHSDILYQMAHKHHNEFTEPMTVDISTYLDMLKTKYNEKLITVKAAVLMYEGKI